MVGITGTGLVRRALKCAFRGNCSRDSTYFWVFCHTNFSRFRSTLFVHLRTDYSTTVIVMFRPKDVEKGAKGESGVFSPPFFYVFPFEDLMAVRSRRFRRDGTGKGSCSPATAGRTVRNWCVYCVLWGMFDDLMGLC